MANRLLSPPAPKPRRPSEVANATSIKSSAEDRKWKEREREMRAEEAMSTLMRAEEHRKDGGLMRDVAKLAAKKAEALKSFTGKSRK